VGGQHYLHVVLNLTCTMHLIDVFRCLFNEVLVIVLLLVHHN
jgi:hypothetical protein